MPNQYINKHHDYHLKTHRLEFTSFNKFGFYSRLENHLIAVSIPIDEASQKHQTQ